MLNGGLEIRDLTGRLRSWIEVGTPEAMRLHKAAKASPRVAVYAHKDVTGLLERLAAEQVHRASEIEVYAVDRELLGGLVARIGSTVYDGSVRGQLQALGKRLAAE